MGWTSTDGVLGGLVLLSLLVGAWRGLVHELMSLAGWAVAYGLAQWQAQALAPQLPWLAEALPPVRYAVAFGMVFVGSLVLWAWLSWLVRKVVETAGLRPIDRSLGALFGALRGALLVLIAAALVHLVGWRQAPWWASAQLPPWLDAVLLGLKPLLPEMLQSYLP